jgi:RHS repeat-associated protein
MDAQGSVTDVTQSDGTLRTARQYDAWGNYRNGTAPQSSDPKLGYTGHQFDSETSLIYARARYYDPEIGVFLSRDPRDAPAADAPWLHRYAYVQDNPLKFIDPDGLVCRRLLDGTMDCVSDNRQNTEEAKWLFLRALDEGEYLAAAGYLAQNTAYRAVGVLDRLMQLMVGPENQIILAKNAWDAGDKKEVAKRAVGFVGATLELYATVEAGRTAKDPQPGNASVQVTEDSATVKAGLPSARTLAEQKAAELRASGGKLPSKVAAAVDTKTGEVSYGTSGKPLPETVHPDIESKMPAKSKERWPVSNCAEFKACNDRLLQGSEMEDLEVHTVVTKTGAPEARCDNCKITTAGSRVTSDPPSPNAQQPPNTGAAATTGSTETRVEEE